MSRTISKKSYPELFQQVLSGDKTFDVRIADFDVRQGDILEQIEVDHDGQPTGRSIRQQVGAVLRTKDVDFWNQVDIDTYGFQVISLMNVSAEHPSMIDAWLVKFKQGWLSKDIDTVLDLFADDVEYHETPFRIIKDKVDLRNEWLAIEAQNTIELEMNVISRQGATYTVKWQLSYEKDNSQHVWEGLYIIKLRQGGLCEYFYQVGEERA